MLAPYVIECIARPYAFTGDKLLHNHTGCPRMIYTVFQKNIKNTKSMMSPILILLIKCLICVLHTVKISFTYLDPLRCCMVSLEIDVKPKCHISANGQLIKTLHKHTRVFNSSFPREKSPYPRQYLA